MEIRFHIYDANWLDMSPAKRADLTKDGKKIATGMGDTAAEAIGEALLQLPRRIGGESTPCDMTYTIDI